MFCACETYALVGLQKSERPALTANQSERNIKTGLSRASSRILRTQTRNTSGVTKDQSTIRETIEVGC